MEALLAQGNSEKCKSHFNAAFLAGSDYSLFPKRLSVIYYSSTSAAKASLTVLTGTMSIFILSSLESDL